MRTIKVVDGKVYLCQEIVASCKETAEYRPIAYDAAKLQNCVLKRMQHCMEELQWAVDHNLIVEVIDVDGLGKHYRYLSGDGFVTGSYEAMEAVLVKLQPFVDKDEVVPATWLDENLSINEAAQLFKACITHVPYWGTAEERLFAVVDAARMRHG